MKRTILLIIMLLVGFLSGVVYSIYNTKVTSVEQGSAGYMITLELMNQQSNYYFEK